MAAGMPMTAVGSRVDCRARLARHEAEGTGCRESNDLTNLHVRTIHPANG